MSERPKRNTGSEGNNAVRNSDESDACRTVEEQLVPYVKGSLAREEQVVVERHLSNCANCSRELEEAKKMIRLLSDYEEAFCPGPQEIFDVVNYGEDPTGSISRHLERCSRCRAAAEASKFLPKEITMPEHLWSRIQGKLLEEAPVRPSLETEGWFSRVRGWLSSVPRLPVMAMATAAAVGALVMILYPEPTMIGLSSVTWGDPGEEMVFKSGRTTPDSEHLAHVVTFKGFKEPLPQKRIDQLYRALKPSRELRKRLDFVTPAQVRTALKGKREFGSTSEMLADLRNKLGITKVVVSTVTQEGGSLKVASELIDTKNGEALSQSLELEAPKAELPSKLRETAYSVLEGVNEE